MLLVLLVRLVLVENSCVRSGYCCKQAPCAFGVWDSSAGQCKFLEGGVAGKYLCGIYDWIMSLPAERMASVNPAFGHGCCSSLNSDRLNVLYIERSQ